MRGLNEQAQHAYLETLASWMAHRDTSDARGELRYAERNLDSDRANGIRAALEYLDKGGPEMDVERVNRHVQRIMMREIFPIHIPVDRRANDVPLIRIALRFDAPWMKQPQELNLEVGLADMLRAFAPLPRNHDAMPSIREMEEMRRKKEERTKYTTQLSNELMRALRRMVESGDPIKGLYPENSIHEPKA